MSGICDPLSGGDKQGFVATWMTWRTINMYGPKANNNVIDYIVLVVGNSSENQ